jgi:hypothetical protein
MYLEQTAPSSPPRARPGWLARQRPWTLAVIRPVAGCRLEWPGSHQTEGYFGRLGPILKPGLQSGKDGDQQSKWEYQGRTVRSTQKESVRSAKHRAGCDTVETKMKSGFFCKLHDGIIDSVDA